MRLSILVRDLKRYAADFRHTCPAAAGVVARFADRLEAEGVSDARVDPAPAPPGGYLTVSRAEHDGRAFALADARDALKAAGDEAARLAYELDQARAGREVTRLLLRGACAERDSARAELAAQQTCAAAARRDAVVAWERLHEAERWRLARADYDRAAVNAERDSARAEVALLRAALAEAGEDLSGVAGLCLDLAGRAGPG